MKGINDVTTSNNNIETIENNNDKNKRRNDSGNENIEEGYLNEKGNESLVSGTRHQVDDVQQVESSGPFTAPDAFRRSNYVATTVVPPLWLMTRHQERPTLTAIVRGAKIMRG